MHPNRTRVMVEIALTIALSAVLHFLKVWQMPMGGSVSLEMLPLLVLGLRRGPVVGLIAGALFGTLDYFVEPFFVHWIQLFLDYPLAYAAVGGVAGLWASGWRRLNLSGPTWSVAWVISAAAISASIARYLFHFASGVVYFATTAMGGRLPDGHSAFESATALGIASGYSALYNLYVPVSAAACLAAMLVLLPMLERAMPAGERP